METLTGLRMRRFEKVVGVVRERGGNGPGVGRPPGFDRDTYHRRNTAGRCFTRLKAIRGIATGCDKTAPSYEAAVSLPSLLFSARSL
ncbi:hypothetical protein [Streptomyces sp. V2I9]|uniref:hypothetical protein n=1 Tax=Streptomyces sp. V2I9 TaxID=3042304 RepID=UPI00277FFE77|nr:hypothetical protein [Streptomyces sp. V2I9]MDQ0985777.1 transposase [Streptomyces sp. V2I9]